MKPILSEKIEQTFEILREKVIDAWLIFVRESDTIKDPSIDIVIDTSVTWQTAFVFTASGGAIAIAGSLDVANLKTKGIFTEVTGYVQSVREPLLQCLTRLNPGKIAVNFSVNSVLADGLTHGMYLQLIDILKETPFVHRLVSSEDIIAALRGRKSSSELKLMKRAIAETLMLIDGVTRFIRPGKTEFDVADFLKRQMEKLGVGPAWDPEYCPSVFTGPESAGAHAGPTNRKIAPGHIVNIDFGIKLEGYASDLQRTWYVLRRGEARPPGEVTRGFNVIRDSIKKAAAFLKPGAPGHEVDAVAREYIVSRGFSEYPHALGHQIGRIAHDGGGLLAPKWERYGNLPFMPVEAGQVYTLEPRLTVEGFGVATIEEEVVVTGEGCRFLSRPQTKLWIVKS